jgi:acetyl/propionyl-CoA carboxylase alpha subunit
MLYEITIDGKNYRLDLNRADGRWSCRLDGRDFEIDAILTRPDVLSLRIGNLAYEVKSERLANDLHLWVGSTCFAVEVRDPRSLRGRTRAGDDHGPRKITAPMPGKEIKSPKKGTIQKILVSEGAAVNAGDVLAIVE